MKNFSVHFTLVRALTFTLMAVAPILALASFDSAALTQTLQSKKDAARVSGLQIVVNQNGQPVYAANLGVNAKTLFYSASMTKMLTATAVLQLQERHKLDLQAPIARYLPWLAEHPSEQARRITLAQVLSHTSGMSRNGVEFWSNPARWEQSILPTEDELKLATLQQTFGVLEGTRLKYSNLGFELLGLVIGEVCDRCIGTTAIERYMNYVSVNILMPLEMQNTGFTPTAEELTLFETPMSRLTASGDRKPFAVIANAGASAAAWGLFSTAAEFTKFMEEIAKVARNEKNVLFQSDVSQLVSKPVAMDLLNPALGHSMGFRIWKTNKGILVGHSGTFPGYSSASFVSLSENTVGTVYLNSIDAGGVSYLMEAFTAITGEKLAPEASQISEPSLGPAFINNPFATLIGKYVIVYEDVEVIYENDHYFFIQFGIKMPLENLHLSADGRFIEGKLGTNAGYFSYVGDSIRFDLDDAGRVKQILAANSILGLPATK